MENTFNLKQFLSESKLLKEEPSFKYPQEILDMDAEIEDLKAKLQAAITAKNKAKSNYTKSIPSLSDDPEFSGKGLKKDKRWQYRYKDFIEDVKKISQESGNDWDVLIGSLKKTYGENLRKNPYGDKPYPMLDIHGLAQIYLIKDDGKGMDKKYTKSYFYIIGNWWVAPL